MHSKDKLWTKNFIIASLANFLFACSFYLLMPTIPLYLSDVLQVQESEIGIVLSSYILALLLIRPFGGYLVDTYSRKPLYLFGVTVFVVLFIGYYFAVSILFFVILRFFHGLFWGLSSVSSNTVAIDIIPSSRRAEGIGYFGASMNIAMAFAPFLAVKIYDTYSFNTLISSAILVGGLSILTISFIQTPKKIKIEKAPSLSFDRFILVKAIPIFVNQVFLSFGFGTIVAYAVLYGKKIDINNPGVFFLFMAVGIILSRVTSGKLVDKGHIHAVILTAISSITIGYIFFALFQNATFYSLSAFILGLGFGTLLPALQTIYINMAPATQRGTANSTYLTGFDVGIGIGMLAGAYIADVYDFKTMYLFVAVLSFVALIIYWTNSIKVYEKHKLR